MIKSKFIVPLLFCMTTSVSGYAQQKSCLVCNFKMSPESSKSGEADPCDDLFGASCMGADGKPKYAGISKEMPKELSKPIKEARDKTAKEMGFKDFDDAIKNKLKNAGIDLKDSPDEEAFKSLKMEGGTITYGGDNAKKLYSSVEQCDKEQKELQGTSYYNLTEASALNDLLKKYESFASKHRELSVKHFAKDIPNFISNNIGNKCNQLKSSSTSSSSSYKPEENQEIVKACENFQKIKRQAIDLYRAEGTADYDKKAEDFVRENMLPELKYSYSSATSTSGTTPAPEKTEVEKLRDKISALSSSSYSVCQNYSSVIENAGRKVVQDLMEKVSKSKTTVDGVIDSFYTEDRKKLAMSLYNTARADVQDLAKSFVKDNKKRGDILDGYDSLKLFWMEKPTDSAYTTKDGVKVLDIEKASLTDMTAQIFSDPSLSFFTQVNAFYTPQAQFGKMKMEEQVNMMPAFVYNLDKNPYAFLSVVAHEAGHKIGPMVSKINGYDLEPEYRELLNCYKDNKSIKLEEQQKDETIADYISSEVLARQIQKLPAEKRKQALMSSMEDFCIFDDYGNHNHSISCKGSHPENSLRVGGVYGANPSIRKIMGCEKDSPKFKTCGLKTSILNLPEVGSVSSGNTNSNTDNKATKGVR